MKLKIYKIIFTILIFALLIVIGLIGKRYYNNYENNLKNKEVVETFSKNLETEEKEEVLINGYKVIGCIKIPKIDIEYPIVGIDNINPDETKEPMKFSIVRYWGGEVNQLGNLSIAGHNNYDGTMFGKTKELEIGDIVELTDLLGEKVTYRIYDIFKTDPNDVTILETKDKNIREVTLITCTNGNKQRLILKAKEI